MTTSHTPNAIEAVVLENLQSMVAVPAAVAPDARLAELEVDSLDLVELAQLLEDQHGIALVGTKDLDDLITVGDVVEWVLGRADADALAH